MSRSSARGSWAAGLVASVALGLSLSVGGCGTSGGTDAKVPTVEVTRHASFTRRVTAEGYLEAVEATPVTAPQDSEMAMKIAWIADEGASIEAGEVVVRFDPEEMQRQLEDSQGDLESALASMQKERDAGRSAISKREQSAAQAQREITAAMEFEPEDNGVMSRNELLDSQIDIDLAEAKAEHAHAVKRVERAVSNSRVELLEISKRQAENEVRRAQEALAHLEVTAPHAGIWVLERDWRGQTHGLGDTVWPGQKLAELPLVANMQAALFVLEADAGDLEAGLKAELVIEAHPDKIYPATVKRVDALAQPRHTEVPVQYFGVTLEFEETDAGTMKVGQRVRATIFIEQQDALVVPRQAVFEREGHFFVYRASDRDSSGFEEAEVELGASSAGRVVIAKGLEDHDRIALRDPNKRADELIGEPGSAEPGQGAKPE
ncbi:efflux RND transporter periplasmic adaptor subunit [Enhygromyxa salina]|uniref:Macrolide transporter subunit MacA n=1 Tax=Enhygromyxa salina TaxID=215803 RepID=A0A2S9YLT9_9BACT|nr:HlyD family efflux transporter periplasmic adaptor subunit [Enhygromyxa salina]PRQ06074.1 macrolide transporter subunit MacA [Enhygromyxa salina]